jgi:hypothetical protein
MSRNRICDELRELRDDYCGVSDHARLSGKPVPPVPVADLSVILRQAAHAFAKGPAVELYGIAEELQRRFGDGDSVRTDAACAIVGHALAGTLRVEMLARVDALLFTMITMVIEVLTGKEHVARC